MPGSEETAYLFCSAATMAAVLVTCVLFSAHTVIGLLEKESSDVLLQLQVLEDVLQGPLSGHDIVLYLDPNLEVRVLQQVLALPALRDILHVLTDLGSNGALWSQNQPAAVLRAAHLIHVVVFVENPRPFFENLSIQWNPKYLMLFSLGNRGYQSLLHHTLQRVEKLILMEKLSPRSPVMASRVGIYTFFPFSTERKPKLIGIWNSRVYSKLQHIFVDRFPSFEGYKFQLGTWLIDIPYLYEKENTTDGVAEEMLKAIAQVLNYSYALTLEPPDCSWGSLENGSWSGMLGMIERSEKNFTVNSMSFTHDRMEAFEASVSYWMEGFRVTMMVPPSLAKWRRVYFPFMMSVWLSVGLVFTLAVLVMTVQVRLCLS